MVLAALGALLGGCGAPGLHGHHYRDSEAEYLVGDLGDDWRRLRLRDNDLAWRNAHAGAIVQMNATCDPFQDVPLSALTGHLLIGFTEREWKAQERIPLDGREALRSHVVASLDGVPRELLLVVLKKDYCTYDMALIAPAGDAFQATRPAFERFVEGFTTEVGSR